LHTNVTKFIVGLIILDVTHLGYEFMIAIPMF
jgi:hypothetical protein